MTEILKVAMEMDRPWSCSRYMKPGQNFWSNQSSRSRTGRFSNHVTLRFHCDSVVCCIYCLSLMHPEATGCWCQHRILILLTGGVPHPSPLGKDPSHYELWVMAKTFPLPWPADNSSSRKWCHNDAKGQLGGWWCCSAASSLIHPYCPLGVTGRRAVRKLIIGPKAGGDTMASAQRHGCRLTGTHQHPPLSTGHPQGEINTFISICFHVFSTHASKSIHSLLYFISVVLLLSDCVGLGAAVG